MKASLAVDALRSAVARRDHPAGVVVHSDRGSQFRSNAFVGELKDHQLTGSMHRIGACGDNAAMESWTWIEKTYHRRRRQRALGKLTPIEFETINEPAAHAA
jgi:transposase InsO family protein